MIGETASWSRSRAIRLIWMLLCVLAGCHFVVAHLHNKTYIDLPAYFAGHERLPFQRRVLPIFLVRALTTVLAPVLRLDRNPAPFHAPAMVCLLLIDLCAFAAACQFTLRLHRAAAPASRMRFLVYPMFLFSLLWTFFGYPYAYYYPYDMLSLAFFTAGLYCVYTRRFLPLLAIVLVGSFNRETTLFLIPLFVIDALGTGRTAGGWHRLPLLRIAALTAAWLAVKLLLSHWFRHNPATDDFLRLHWNRQYASPLAWPELFAAGGYLPPIVCLLARRLPDPRLRAYLWVVPLWFLTMCCYGILEEIRIFAELCPLFAVAATLLLERYAAHAFEPAQNNPDSVPWYDSAPQSSGIFEPAPNVYTSIYGETRSSSPDPRPTP